MEPPLPDFVVPADSSDGPRVVVVTRAGCHLCEDAEASVASICSELGVPWQAIDVDAAPQLRAQFTDHVPVTFVDGVQLSIWFLDPDALRAALSS